MAAALNEITCALPNCQAYAPRHSIPCALANYGAAVLRQVLLARPESITPKKLLIILFRTSRITSYYSHL